MEQQPSLVRRLGLGSAVALVVSNMIGTGIFTTTGFLAGDLGQPRLIFLSWIVGAISALLGAICYSELAINFPRSGGEYVYLSHAYGRTWGFISGWVSLLAGFSAPVAAAALSFASYVAVFFPRWERFEQQVVACALVALFCLANLFGVRRAARLQNALTTLKLTLLVGFILSGLLLGHGDWGNFAQTAVRTTGTPLPQQFVLSLFWIYVAYSGWNAAAYVAEEIKNPAQTLSWALALGTVLVTAVYLALNATFFYAVPAESMKGVMAVGALSASHLFGPRIAGAFSALMACSLLSTVNAMTIAGPRVYYAMARDGQFFQFAETVHERWRTPVNAILVQGISTILLVFTPFPQLVVYIGFTLNLFAVMSVASLFIFRRQPGWRRLGIVSFAYPLLPCLFISVGACMTIEGVLQKP
ncbi:MAG: amino acid permease, partial [Acidobacteriaceae bacterium]|nr:amino acid permease [Acidobacteriaceae bacterium]